MTAAYIRFWLRNVRYYRNRYTQNVIVTYQETVI